MILTAINVKNALRGSMKYVLLFSFFLQMVAEENTIILNIIANVAILAIITMNGVNQNADSILIHKC